MAKRSALGKGLGALISDANDLRGGNSFPEIGNNISSNNNSSNQNPALLIFSQIPVDKIVTNPYQPRSTFEESALEELAESIKLLGVIQPITVRIVEDKYQIISGERRYRASLKAGLKEIPAYIRKTDDQGSLEMAIVENIQREDLNAMEIALSFQRLIEECNLTQEMMADRVGKKRATVTNYLRILRLPAEIQLSIKSGDISLGHAKSILSLDKEEDQIKLCSQIIEKSLSVRQTEKRVQDIIIANKEEEGKEDKEEEKKELPEPYYRILEILGSHFNNNISLKRSEKGKGHITIQFKSDAEMESFLNVLEKCEKQ